MHLTFVLPGIPTRPTGGSKIVLEYANRLVKRDIGVTATICYLSNPSKNRMGMLPLPLPAKRQINRFRAKIHPRWFTLDNRIERRCIFAIDDNSIPDGDWVFATAAVTANGVSNLSASKGKKGYIIQDFETWDLPESALEATFNLGMENIVIAHWLKDVVDMATGGDCKCIPNPVDVSVFRPIEGIKRERHTIAVLYHGGAHKGFPIAWEAIKQARKELPDLKVLMFGTFAPPSRMPYWVEYTRNASTRQLLKIYNSAAVFCCASVNEGYGLTCVEAMSCGCALVVTDFPGSREYAIDGKNALVCPVNDVERMAADIVKLINDFELRNRLGDAGIKTAQLLSWDEAINRFAKVLGI